MVSSQGKIIRDCHGKKNEKMATVTWTLQVAAVRIPLMPAIKWLQKTIIVKHDENIAKLVNTATKKTADHVHW